MRRCQPASLFFGLLVLFAGGCEGCFDPFADDESGGLTPYLDPATLSDGSAPPACDAVTLSATAASPFARIDVDFAFTSFDPDAFGVELFFDGDPTGDPDVFLPVYRDDDGFYFGAPPHPQGIDGGTVHLRFDDGQIACDDAVEFTVLPLDPAPGAFEDLIEHSTALATEVVESFGYSVDDIIGTDYDALPAPLIPLAIQIWSLGHPDNPNSLQANLSNDTLPFDYSAEDLHFAEALVAASGHVDNLILRRQAIEELVADNPDIDPRILSTQTLLQDGTDTRQQGLCSTFNASTEVQINTQGELSYYMQKARRLEAHGERVDNVATIVGVLGVFPGPSAVAAAIVSLVLAIDQLLSSAHANLYPRELTDPFVEVFTHEFNEDFLNPGEWGRYHVTAYTEGWDATADIIDAIISTSFAVASIAPGVHRPTPQVRERIESHIEAIVEESSEFVIDFAKNIVAFLAENALSAVNNEVFGDSGLCVIQPGPWYDIHIDRHAWVDVEFHGAIAPLLGENAGDFCTEIIQPTRNQYQPLHTGDGVAIFSANQTRFPTRTDPFGSRLNKEVQVHPIDVDIEPTRRVAFPGETLEITGLIENAHNRQGRWVADDTLEVLSQQTPSDGEQHIEVRAPQSAEDFPAGLLLLSRAQTGLRHPLCDPVARFELVTISNEESLDIIPRHRCLPEGGSFQFEAELAHPDSDARLEWSASAGTIDDTGFFQAPDDSGEYTIRASVVGDDLEDSVQVRVGDCGCFFDARVTGGGLNLHLSNYGRMFAYEQDGTIQIQMIDPDKERGVAIQGYLDSGEFIGGVTDDPDAIGYIATEGDLTLLHHPDTNHVQGSYQGTGGHLGEFFDFLHIGEDAQVFEYRLSVNFMVPLSSGIQALLPNEDCSPP